MATRNQKVLPQLPGPYKLSIEALTHLKGLINHISEDETDIGGTRVRESWSDAIEGALHDVGASIVTGGWLAGFKRANATRVQSELSLQAYTESSLRNSSAGEASPSRNDDLASTYSVDAKLQHLRELTNRPATSSPKPPFNHLLLTVSPFNHLPLEDSGFSIVRSGIGCRFTPNTFVLTNEDAVLYGLNEWSNNEDESVRLVGGTFAFTGTTSMAQQAALCKVLRLSIYMHLSLYLEEQFLSNSHVQLTYSKQPLRALPALPAATSVERSLSTPEAKAKVKSKSKSKAKRDSVTSGLRSLLTKTENLIHRAASVGPAIVRHGSLDLPLSRKRKHGLHIPPVPDDNNSLYSRNSSLRHHPTSHQSFADLLADVNASRVFLSTTPGVLFPLPTLLIKLAERERRHPDRQLSGDEKTALQSMLCWNDGTERADEMGNATRFVQQQNICMLYVEHVPDASVIVPPTMTMSGSVISTPPIRVPHCGSRRRMVTYRFYGRDKTLGGTIVSLCERADAPCSELGCPFKRAEHERRWIHNGMRIVANVALHSGADQAAGAINEDIEMWQRCNVCGAATRKERMLHGTYLLSFGKFLEMLVYSSILCVLEQPPCEHTTAPPQPWTGADLPLPRMRVNVVRCFAYRGRNLSFTLSTVDEIFELRVPRLQILQRNVQDASVDALSGEQLDFMSTGEDDRRVLRREIMRWWQGLSDRMDKIEDTFISDHSYLKSLPRLPSADQAFDPFIDDGAATPKGASYKLPPLPPLPPNASQTPTVASHGSYPSTDPRSSPASTHSSPKTVSDYASSSATTASTVQPDSFQLLSSLRYTFQRTEQDLYTELSQTPSACLNDIRRSFITAARGAERRLSAWEVKHAVKPKGTIPSEVSSVEAPAWWRDGCHAVPGGNVIVREDDWGSIIAFTLSSLDYQRELSNLVSARSFPMPPVPPPTPSGSRRPSFLTGASFKRLINGSAPLPDPDQEGVIWHEPETYSAIISRKDHPRDATSLLSIREVLRQKTAAEGTNSTPNSKFGLSVGRGIGGILAPPSAWAKPAMDVSKESVEGQLDGDGEPADKTLHEINLADPSRMLRRSVSNGEDKSSGFVETHIQRGKASSFVSADNGPAEADSNRGQMPILPPPLRKDSGQSETSPVDPTSSVTSSITNTLSTAMRYMMKTNDSANAASSKHHQGPGSPTQIPVIDERPHIKYDWTIGKRLRFSCTVYYARQFDMLRKRCGIEEVFLRSLAKSDNWAAQGGKSRSNFWKTSDDRFIIKTLVNAWNVADLQVLIDLGPSYFRYMDATASNPTVLAKLLGFYTVEIKNMETGSTQAKADLLIMENLFYNQKIDKMFDLKGIQGRKVKAAASSPTSKMLFDSEWIEGQQKKLTLVLPYSKLVLRDAVRADCDFLAKSNIMDYSLLLGIDKGRKQIACGLVDTIGSYTFAKTLEYKAKQGLHNGKEVTVIPPNEYRERFMTAMDSYFLACPDKWSRPLDDTKVPNDYKELPSVL